MEAKKPTLSRREREILDILLELREATAQEVRERLADPPSNSAARALLARLEKKGAISHIERDLRYENSWASNARGESEGVALGELRGCGAEQVHHTNDRSGRQQSREQACSSAVAPTDEDRQEKQWGWVRIQPAGIASE